MLLLLSIINIKRWYKIFIIIYILVNTMHSNDIILTVCIKYRKALVISLILNNKINNNYFENY